MTMTSRRIALLTVAALATCLPAVCTSLCHRDQAKSSGNAVPTQLPCAYSIDEGKFLPIRYGLDALLPDGTIRDGHFMMKTERPHPLGAHDMYSLREQQIMRTEGGDYHWSEPQGRYVRKNELRMSDIIGMVFDERHDCSVPLRSSELSTTEEL